MSNRNIRTFTVMGAVLFFLGCEERPDGKNSQYIAYSEIQPHVIQLDIPPASEGMGGVITSDIDGDGEKDFIVTGPGYAAAYTYSGKKLWLKQTNIQVTQQSEKYGLPGWHGPGVQVTDVDGDGRTEVLFLTRHGTLEVIEGSTGETKRSIKLQPPADAERWEHLVIANFRGLGDRDLLLQATNAKGYRMGRHLAAYALEELMRYQQGSKPLWTRDDFVANAHNGARVADLDGDGRDEVVGPMIVGPDGDVLYQIPLRGHIDSLFVADVRPDIPGLEVVALEEGGNQRFFPGENWLAGYANRILNLFWGGGNRVFLYNLNGLIWETHYKRQEPQNAAVGDFDPKRPGLEIWCRSRYDKHQKPFVFDAQGRLITRYEMDVVAPAGWTEKGVEVIFTIHWTGDQKQLAAAKERHASGDVGIFDPMSGRFLYRFRETAYRLYIADVAGDWREEVLVLSGNELHVYSNQEANPDPNRSRLWAENHYRRNKMTWNYYSP